MIHLLVDEKSVIDVFSVRKALGLLNKKSKIFLMGYDEVNGMTAKLFEYIIRIIC